MTAVLISARVNVSILGQFMHLKKALVMGRTAGFVLKLKVGNIVCDEP